MCELMGMCFARPIPADFSIREFALRDVENADGWGLAWYPDRSLALVKEPVPWQASPYTGFLQTYQRLVSPIYIAHVRHRTVGGEPTHGDTHPFARELYGREYCFAHNGTVKELSNQFPLGRYRPVGRTDSEYAFCHIMEDLALRARAVLEEPDDFRWLHGKLSTLNQNGKLNVLLSDGRRLFAYRDVAGHKGLTMRELRMRSPEPRQFEDQDIRVELAGDSANHGFVIATRPLNDQTWYDLQPGELIAIENGAVGFSSHRDPAVAEFGVLSSKHIAK
jgi:glutamine amidotransferase